MPFCGLDVDVVEDVGDDADQWGSPSSHFLWRIFPYFDPIGIGDFAKYLRAPLYLLIGRRK
mgnify:CR=1 FL=1